MMAHSFSRRFAALAFGVASVLLCAIPVTAFASATDGTIDGTYRYAWSENGGWVDFGSAAGNVHITDTALTGSAYGENIGWITLNPPTYGGVTNDGAGNLSGYAWSENAGWIDFSKVTIGTDGVFAGDAYSPNIGWIAFGTGNDKVSTDWRPASVRTAAPAPAPTPAPAAKPAGMPSYGVGGGMPNPLPGAVPSAPPPAVSAPRLSGTQVASIVSLLQSFGVDAATIASVQATLSGTSAARAPSFARDLTIGMQGEDVRQLQVFLNAHGAVIATAGAGSPGQETDYFGPATQAALAKFQAVHGITPAGGYFGPKTRNFITTLTP